VSGLAELSKAMRAVPVPPLRVIVALAVNVVTTLPTPTVHGSAEDAAIVKTVDDVRVTRHVVRPETVLEPPPPLPPPCTVQVPGPDVQT
jgi:hypothetical protein